MAGRGRVRLDVDCDWQSAISRYPYRCHPDTPSNGGSYDLRDAAVWLALVCSGASHAQHPVPVPDHRRFLGLVCGQHYLYAGVYRGTGGFRVPHGAGRAAAVSGEVARLTLAKEYGEHKEYEEHRSGVYVRPRSLSSRCLRAARRIS